MRSACASPWRTHSCVPCPQSCGHLLRLEPSVGRGAGTARTSACATSADSSSVSVPTGQRDACQDGVRAASRAEKDLRR